jgi:hypothetical protein
MVGRPTDQANRPQASSVIHVAFTARDDFAIGAHQPPPPRSASGIVVRATARLAALLIDLEMHAPYPFLCCSTRDLKGTAEKVSSLSPIEQASHPRSEDLSHHGAVRFVPCTYCRRNR